MYFRIRFGLICLCCKLVQVRLAIYALLVNWRRGLVGTDEGVIDLVNGGGGDRFLREGLAFIPAQKNAHLLNYTFFYELSMCEWVVF